jgi:precorrin-2/cobalt-factor-2 C20-methyltransferase
MSSGTIHGVGLGPGNPDLMSVRADRLVREAQTIAYFRKKGRAGQARQIVDGILHPNAIEIAMEYPVTTEIPVSDPRYNAVLSAFYADCAADLQARAQAGQDIVVLCEGDPFFYGSFMHLYTRLSNAVPIEVVPAITGMSGAWTATGQPITWGDDVMTVLMGTLPQARLEQEASRADALVIMKIGRNFAKVCDALKASGRFEDAWLIEYATMAKQTVCRLRDAGERVTPYFSIIVVHGQGRRP